ncbi:MFS general substrate transporter [Microstroma glucosiphilum]|uniref:MFS general substrate transporter n=1 Tax=Pseudomicrostroma glucosiphilum TaxID=1684307 RepID=A0A316U2A8_9BASI|nr:MFS general substrate transporter [Pseudomicrostroma glucosiphilum]PWN18948.1 MFS general substrate transporter [Pseudomicrostroma glucosiphilum]
MEFEGQLDDVTEEEYRKLVRKIDWHILPLMLLTYAIQFADKTSLGSSAILGIKTDLNLTTARYNNCSSFFYITYLACAWPNSLLLQRFNTGWVLTAATASWATLLLCTMACSSYGGFLTTRLLLGATEGLVTPGFLLLTSAFYRHEEQATRVGLWFLMNGAATVFSAMVAYGAQYITIGDWSPWRPFFLILGLIGCLNTALWLWVMPSTPATARWLTRREKAMALKRVACNQDGSKNVHFKWEHVREAALDPRIWLMFVFSILQNIPNSLTQQRSIIIEQFGFTRLQTSLLNIPTGVLEMITIPTATWAARRWKTIHVMTFWTIPAIVGASMLLGLSQEHKVARLVAIYFFLSTASFVLGMSWNSSCSAGSTKKMFSNALFLIGYCVGNIAGPLMWKAEYSPVNTVPWSIILATLILAIPTSYAAWYIAVYRNKRKEEAQAGHRSAHEVEVKVQEGGKGSEKGVERHHLDSAFLDLTDKQNPNFRYPV